MTYTVTVYQSGNSKVITIPAGLDVEIGDTFSVSQRKEKIILNKSTPSKIKLQHQLIDKLTGDLPDWDPEHNDIEELEKFIEDRDEY